MQDIIKDIDKIEWKSLEYKILDSILNYYNREKNIDEKNKLDYKALLFLLEYSEKNKDNSVLSMTEKILNDMYKGEVFDHIGYGFFDSAYGSDWENPNYKKSLKNNIGMAKVYTKAYNITGQDIYKNISNKIIHFIFRYLDANNNLYYSSLKENMGDEYYLIKREEILDLLGDIWGNTFCDNYNIKSNKGYIPNLIDRDLKRLDPSLGSMLDMIYEYRALKKDPILDKNIDIGFNALLIGYMMDFSMDLNNPLYMRRAKDMAEYILINLDDFELTDKDYMAISNGFVRLYDKNKDKKYLEKSIDIMESIDNQMNYRDIDIVYLFIENNILLYNIKEEERYREIANKTFNKYIYKNLRKEPIKYIKFFI